MNFLGRVFRYLFWLVVISWGVAILRRVVGWMLRGGSTAPVERKDADEFFGPAAARGTAATPSNLATDVPGGGRRLVRDPVCGVHVAEVLAVPLRDGGELMHFCSKACRDKYAGGMQKFAANG